MICLSGKTSGTCVPDCEGYGVCHCEGECGATTALAPQTSQRRKMTRGEPAMYRQGHSPGSSGARLRPGDKRRWTGPPGYHTDDVPIERVQPLVELLVERAGTISMVAGIIGVDRKTISRYLHGMVPMTSPDIAERIVAQVLALRLVKDPDAPNVPHLPVLRPPTKPSRGKTSHVAAAPLADFLRREGHALDGFGGSFDRNLHRWFAAGIAPLFAVDEFCTQELHLHPSQVYGDEWPDSPSFNEQEAIA